MTDITAITLAGLILTPILYYAVVFAYYMSIGSPTEAQWRARQGELLRARKRKARTRKRH